MSERALDVNSSEPSTSEFFGSKLEAAVLSNGDSKSDGSLPDDLHIRSQQRQSRLSLPRDMANGTRQCAGLLIC